MSSKNNNPSKCNFCHLGGTEIQSIDKRWWSEAAEKDSIPFIRAVACLNPIPSMEIHIEMFNQHIVSDAKNDYTYPLDVGFKINFCPICGRKLNSMDRTLMSTMKYANDPFPMN